MKKILYIIAIFILSNTLANAQQVCCPEFELVTSITKCYQQNHPAGGTMTNQNSCDNDFFGCKHSKDDYFVFPKKAGYTYTWTVVGGTITSTTGDHKEITWGNLEEGTITVVISNPSGTCKKTLTEKVCLLDAPTAGFSFSPNSPVCANQLVQFTDSSTDAKSWSWNFGDGTSSTDVNPIHSFSAPGTYTITLTVSNGKKEIYQSNNPNNQNVDVECGCKDTITKTITIGEIGITIIPDCKQMLCKGDKATYSTASPCSSYNWSVTGGHIEGAANSETVTVIWDGSFPATVNMTGNCSGSCGNSGSLSVPVVYPTAPILGEIIVCPNDLETYTLPSIMPGTTYTWTVTGGTIPEFNADTNVINIQWGNIPNTTSPDTFYTITCNYNNPITKCSGVATLKVQILPHFKISGNDFGCLNDTFSYTANGNANWKITPNSGATPFTFTNTNSISGNWNAIGAFTVFATPVTPSDFCSFPDSKIVNVIARPILGPITGPIVICPLSTLNYSVTSNRAGGIFAWTIVGGTIVGPFNGSTVSIKWNTTGPYTIAVNQTLDYCNALNNQTLTVTPFPPAVITGTTSSCMDNKETYTVNGPGSYDWQLFTDNSLTTISALGTIIAGEGTNTIQILWHGTLNPPTTCVLQVVTGCGTAKLTVTITIPPVLIITPSGTLCSTSGMTLSSNIIGATSYVWEKDGTVVPTFTTQNINILAHGTYKLTVLKNGCVSKATIVIPKATTNFTANIANTNQTYWLCADTIATNLVATPMPSGSYCYSWMQAGTPTGAGSQVATTQNYTATSVGYFWCEVSICNTGCVEITDRIQIKKQSCGSGGNGGNCNNNYTPAFSFTNCNDPIEFTSNIPFTGSIAFWNFGDGFEGSGNTVSHQYKGIGTYNVCAIYGNGIYCSQSFCKTVTVNIANNFTANVSCANVSFTNLCQVQATASITNYSWSFPGGTPSTYNSTTLTNPPIVNYAVGGSHTAELVITGSDGCIIKYSVDFKTIAIPVILDIPSQICAKSEYEFSVPGTDPDLSYQWEFGDGFISNLQTTTHAYPTSITYPATYIVKLTVTHKNGCSNSLSKSITIIAPISASIGLDKQICPGGKATLNTTTPFSTYQWYKDGIAILGATSASYEANTIGVYFVKVEDGIGGGCVTRSNKITISNYPLPIAKIMADKTQCSADSPIKIQNQANEIGATYLWTVTGPAPLTLANVYNPIATATVPGEYNFEVTVTSKDGCIAKDALCVMLIQSPTITITAPTAPMCEGKTYTFNAIGSGNTTPSDYTILWSNGVTGNTMTTGTAGSYSATIVNAAGCTTSAFAGTIKSLPNISLFPKGCQKACLTDTIVFPLPTPQPLGAYTVTWYDDDGTAVTNVGTGTSLALSSLQPGMHHFYAKVSVAGGCEAKTGVLDLNIKDCTLLPECDNCKDLLSSFKAEADKNITATPNGQISNETITFTILKPVKEVRISMADLKYSWKDPACVNCKTQMLERGCIYASSANQSLGTLTASSQTGSTILSATSTNKCQDDLIWSGGSVLQPGTYTIPFQLSLPKKPSDKCVLVLEKACFNLTLIDLDCKKCETIICKKDIYTNPNDCACNEGNNWSNLFLAPSKPTIAKPKTQIICNDVMTNVTANLPYTLSGVYHCKGKCGATTNEITVYNQVNQIIYTRVSAALYEPITFPEKGMYSVTLTANCGDKKCVCSFRINVDSGGSDDPIDITDIGDTKNPETPKDPKDPKEPKDPKKPIEETLSTILPPDFNGGILVSQNDKVLFEKYYSFKDNVTSHTAFDLASVTKTFTAMAILKLMENGKLNVDDAVNKYLPEFPIAEITIKMLLNHKSGLEDYLKFIDESGWDKTKNLTNQDLLQFIVKNKSKVVINIPGKTFDYSNTNFALLALIIEKTSGQNYNDYLANTFFKPLQMEDTYVMGLDNYAKATKSYYKNGKVYSLRYLDLVYGDKNVYSTVQDLKKWDKGLRDGKLFKKTTLDLAYAPTSKLTPYASNYALGWKKMITSNGNEINYHTGWWAGNRSLLIRLPKENVMIAVVSNNNFTNINDIKKLCDLFGDYELSNNTIAKF